MAIHTLFMNHKDPRRIIFALFVEIDFSFRTTLLNDKSISEWEKDKPFSLT